MLSSDELLLHFVYALLLETDMKIEGVICTLAKPFVPLEGFINRKCPDDSQKRQNIDFLQLLKVSDVSLHAET